MKPAAFDYERPGSLEEATRLLAVPGIFSKAVAGSQSLGPMLNLRLAQPELLVDITAIAELRAVADQRLHVEIGACVTHADIEDGRIPDVARGLLRFVAGRIAYRAVRNRGTIGGSLAHADPAAEWISTFPLLGAEVIACSRRGTRTISAENLMVSSFITVLAPDELIRAVRVPKLSAHARWGFCKLNQKAGEFAHAIGAVLYDPQDARFRAVIGAIETTPIVVPDAAKLFGGPFSHDIADRLDEHAVSETLDAKGVKDQYNRQIALVALKRAARQAGAA
ncbi:MAG: FAD binding domain-containing protein [Proteobacteria bacterium]|nr:FAD binding domain-containing protein [Pseudomonadota bacterium]